MKLGVGALLGSLADQLQSVSARLMRDDTESTLISTVMGNRDDHASKSSDGHILSQEEQEQQLKVELEDLISVDTLKKAAKSKTKACVGEVDSSLDEIACLIYQNNQAVQSRTNVKKFL